MGGGAAWTTAMGAGMGGPMVMPQQQQPQYSMPSRRSYAGDWVTIPAGSRVLEVEEGFPLPGG